MSQAEEGGRETRRREGKKEVKQMQREVKGGREAEEKQRGKGRTRIQNAKRTARLRGTIERRRVAVEELRRGRGMEGEEERRSRRSGSGSGSSSSRRRRRVAHSKVELFISVIN